ncbi:hypothetical protein V6D40_04630 [Corynebacterium sp. Q4381]|uniref:hypothetical protein n=1 Tax=Corynebacterium sp. Marseille-Q4381 TaxID=3121597 RepID=UPI002FE60639
MAFATYKLFYGKETGEGFDEFCAAIIVVGKPRQGSEPEVQLSIVEPHSEHAAAWFDVDGFTEVVNTVALVVKGIDEETLEIHDPGLPNFRLETGTKFEAEDPSTATIAVMDAGPNLFTAFTVEFQPNLKDPSTFPVAVFVFDPRIGRLVSEVYGWENPFAPPAYNQLHVRVVNRRMKELFDSIERAKREGRTISPFKNMGPQFRSEKLPTVEADDIHDALDKAVEYVETYYAVEAS